MDVLDSVQSERCGRPPHLNDRNDVTRRYSSEEEEYGWGEEKESQRGEEKESQRSLRASKRDDVKLTKLANHISSRPDTLCGSKFVSIPMRGEKIESAAGRREQTGWFRRTC